MNSWRTGMFKIVQTGDIVQSPSGNLIVKHMHKNGVAVVERTFEPYDTFYIKSALLRSYLIVDRPSRRNAYRTVEDGRMSPAYVAFRSLRKRADVISIEWVGFQAFADWFYRTRDAYPDWQSVQHDWIVSLNLLDPTNRTASPHKCCLVPFPVHAVMSNENGRSRSNDLPRGVTRMANRYVVHCNRFDAGPIRVGSYATPEEASAAYWSAKIEAIRYTGTVFWSYMPEELAMRMISFGLSDIPAYFSK